MFIKLTRLDNSPIWLNAAFIVTVEPRKGGSGAVVVPIGDGLDYDVRESPDDVLRMLGDAPVPTVVPVPVSDCLTKTPDDVSPESETLPEPEPPAEPKPAPPPEPPAEKKPTKKRTRKTDAAKKAAGTKKAVEKPQPEELAPPAKEPSAELSDDDVARLLKLMPKSIAKLNNTLSSQFKVKDVAATVAALEAKGVMSFDGNHVNWNVK